MSYHAIGALTFNNLSLPQITTTPVPTSGSTFTKEAMLWAQIRTSMPRFSSLVMDVAKSNVHLTSSEKDRLRGEMRKLDALVSTVGVPSGSWSAAQISALRDAKARGGIPNFMPLIEKSRATAAISRGRSIRAAWESLAGLLGTRLAPQQNLMVQMPTTGIRLTAPAPAPTPTYQTPEPDPAAVERARETAARMAAEEAAARARAEAEQAAPVAPEDYLVDGGVPQEWLEQHSDEGLLEEEKAFPWKWVVLAGGVAVVGVGGYLILRK